MRSMLLIALGCVLTGLGGFAQAQSLPRDEARLLRVVETVAAEHRVYAICLALDRDASRLARATWAQEVQQARELIDTLQVSAQFRARFEQAVDAQRMASGDMTLAQAAPWCHRHTKTMQKFFEMGYSQLRAGMLAVGSQPAPRH